MVTKSHASTEANQPELTNKREDALAQISNRIEKGNELLNHSIVNAEELKGAYQKEEIWHEYNVEMLNRIFTSTKISEGYQANSTSIGAFFGSEGFHEEVRDFKNYLRRKLTSLESIRERLPLIPESKSIVSQEPLGFASLLHPLILKECESLVAGGYFGEAVEKSFKLVRDKLRVLTGYETSSEAFGKGGLHIKGAAASNVDDDFQDAVRFLGMAIDKLRNEKAHTPTSNVPTMERAYQYLVVSSLALLHLDKAEIRNESKQG